MNLYKIPSGEINNYPYLKHIASFSKELILSTGMSTLGDIETAINVLTSNGVDLNKITLLHCTSEYPAPIEEVNLNVIKTLRRAFGTKVGYSDHTLGIQVPIAAVALGANIIEKHFTLDKKRDGPDHAASLDPDELKEMVSSIRLIEKSLGNGVKRITKSEKENIEVVRKSIVAVKEIKKGDVFSTENISIKRPGTGLSPMLYYEVIGKKAIKHFKMDDLIET